MDQNDDAPFVDRCECVNPPWLNGTDPEWCWDCMKPVPGISDDRAIDVEIHIYESE